MSSFLQRISGSRPARRVADAVINRYAFWHVAPFARNAPFDAQKRTLRMLVHHARGTRFGRDHDFAGVQSIGDYQARVPLRTYEQTWDDYWKSAYPRLQGVTWPDFIPYYALSSGTTSG